MFGGIPMKKAVFLLSIFLLSFLFFSACTKTEKPSEDTTDNGESLNPSLSESSSSSVIPSPESGLLDLNKTQYLSGDDYNLLDLCWLNESKLILAVRANETDTSNPNYTVSSTLLRIVIYNIETGKERLLLERENDLNYNNSYFETDGEYLYYHCTDNAYKRILLSDGTEETTKLTPSAVPYDYDQLHCGWDILLRESEQGHTLYIQNIFTGEQTELLTETLSDRLEKYQNQVEDSGKSFSSSFFCEWSPDGEKIFFGYTVFSASEPDHADEIGFIAAICDREGNILLETEFPLSPRIASRYWSGDSNKFYLLTLAGEETPLYQLTCYDLTSTETISYSLPFEYPLFLESNLTFSSTGDYCVFFGYSYDESDSDKELHEREKHYCFTQYFPEKEESLLYIPDETWPLDSYFESYLSPNDSYLAYIPAYKETEGIVVYLVDIALFKN